MVAGFKSALGMLRMLLSDVVTRWMEKYMTDMIPSIPQIPIRETATEFRLKSAMINGSNTRTVVSPIAVTSAAQRLIKAAADTIGISSLATPLSYDKLSERPYRTQCPFNA